MMKLLIAITLLATASSYAVSHQPPQSDKKDVGKNLTGFKLTTLEKGSIYDKLGLKQGDVIKTFNGKPINNPKDAMELTHLLKTADKVEIELVRDGSTQKMTYQIK